MEWNLFAQELVISGLAAALVLIFGSIVTPILAFGFKRIRELENEVRDCHEEREQEKVWRVVAEEQIKQLNKGAGLEYPSSQDFPVIEASDKKDCGS